MTYRNHLSRNLVMLVAYLALLPSLLLADPPDSGLVIEHPGKYDLIYYGLQQTEPPLYVIKAHYKYFYVFANIVVPATQVVHPSIQSVYFLEHTVINPGEVVLDIGTGVGIQAIFAAEVARHVVATDISPDAIKNATFNVKIHNLKNKISVRQGDLFSPIKPTETFDVILFNIDYPYDETSQGLWEVHERFFTNVKKHLKANGRIYYQAGFIRNIPRIHSILTKNNLRIIKMDMISAIKHDREPIVFLITSNP